MRRAPLAAFLAALSAAYPLLGAAGVAGAEPARPAALSWVRMPGAEGCIGARALAEFVEQRLGRAALVPMSRADVSVEGRISPVPPIPPPAGATDPAAGPQPRWRVELVVADAKGVSLGSRHLESDALDCHALDTELAVTIALLVDPEAVLPPAAPTGAGTGPGLPLSTPGTSATPGDGLPLSGPTNGPGQSPWQSTTTGRLPPTGTEPGRALAPPPPATSWGVAFLAGPALSIGLLPSASAGAALRAIVTPPRFWPFQVSGVVWAPSAAGFGAEAASFFLATGSLAACPLHTRAGAWRALACAGIEAGEVRAGGFGLEEAYSRGEPIVSGVLQGRVMRRLWGPLTATFGLGLEVPFLRARFYYLDAAGAEREVFLASPLAGSGDLSIGVELP